MSLREKSCWGFRQRLRLGSGMGLDCSEEQYKLTEPDDPREVVLRSWKGGPISDTRDIVLRGSGFSDESEARNGGEKWLMAVLTGFARNNLGADIGKRRAQPFINPELLENLATDEHPVVIHDVQALLVF